MAIWQCVSPIEFAQKDGNAQIIFDQTHDRYLVMHNEWREDYRIYGCAIQLDIIEGALDQAG